METNNISTKKYIYNCNKCILSEIESYIEESGLIVVDLRHHKPNCYYELAYARSLGKEIITIVPEDQKGEIAFDVSGYNYYPYKFEYFGGKTRMINLSQGTYRSMEIDLQLREYCKRNHIPINQE